MTGTDSLGVVNLVSRPRSGCQNLCGAETEEDRSVIKRRGIFSVFMTLFEDFFVLNNR